jgi:hypothetical protein
LPLKTLRRRVGLGGQAFANCSSLRGIHLPDSITHLAIGLFTGCSGLVSVTIPNGVTNVWQEAFSGCSSLTSITIPNSVVEIGARAFWRCTSLTNATIPDSVTWLGFSAFASCTSLTTVALGNGLTSIALYAFSNCTGLVTVTIPASVGSIMTEAFAYCTSLTGVYFLGHAPLVDEDVFEGAENVVVYYVPGATGWGPTFGGRPTMLWSSGPPVVNPNPNPGVLTNGFGFTITGPPGRLVIVEACTNLTINNPFWFLVGTNTLTGGSVYFTDPYWTNYPARFYRVRWP